MTKLKTKLLNRLLRERLGPWGDIGLCEMLISRYRLRLMEIEKEAACL